MEYELKVNQHDVHAEVDTQDDRKLSISIDTGINENMRKHLYDVQYTIVSDHRILMTVYLNGHNRQVNAYVANTPEGKSISINGSYFLVKDLEAREKRTINGIMPGAPDLITPPTPAVVVKIHVETGDFVKKGQAVIVVSAMKMETTLCAPYDGTVSKINTAIKDKVAPGQILMEIEKQENT